VREGGREANVENSKKKRILLLKKKETFRNGRTKLKKKQKKKGKKGIGRKSILQLRRGEGRSRRKASKRNTY